MFALRSILFFGCLAWTCTLTLLRSAEKPLSFLGNHDLPPMIYLTDEGPRGIVVDLTEEIIRRAKLNATIDAIDWGLAQERLRQGEADALLQINSNPERAKIFDFTESLLLSELSIFRRSDRVDVRDIQSLFGRSVGVEGSGYPISILKNILKLISLSSQTGALALSSYRAGLSMRLL